LTTKLEQTSKTSLKISEISLISFGSQKIISEISLVLAKREINLVKVEVTVEQWCFARIKSEKQIIQLRIRE